MLPMVVCMCLMFLLISALVIVLARGFVLMYVL